MSRRSTTRPEIRVGGFWLSSITPNGWGELRHSTRVNGGWEASWTIPDAKNWRHPALVASAPVELMFGPACIVPATLEEPDWDSGQFVATGACRDGESAMSLTVAGETTTKPNTAIDAAKARGAVSWNRVGNFGTTPVGETDSVGGLVSLRSVLDAWAEENQSNWAIANTRRRDLIVAPLDEDEIDWLIVPGSGVLGSASEERVDRIFVRYIADNGTRATASYPSTTPAGGVEKPADITDRGAMDAVKATAIAEGIWSDLRGRPGWTNGLTLKAGQITTIGGVEADLAVPKAGDTARLLGVPDPRGVALHTDVVIGDTEYDWEEDEIQLNPVGIAARDAESVLEEVGNLAVDAMVRSSQSGVASGMTTELDHAGTSGTVTYRVHAGVVFVTANVGFASLANGATLVLVSAANGLPSGSRPSSLNMPIARFSGNGVGIVLRSSDGSISVLNNSGGAVTSVQFTYSYVPSA